MYLRLLALLVFTSFFSSAALANAKKITKIVVDAGHGGSDAGAPGQLSNEKDLTLAIALRLGKMIKDSLRDVQIIYTRTSDVYPTLQERHEIANRAGADLFISIHINATAPHITKTVSGYKTITTRKGKKIKRPIYHTVKHRETSTSGTETYVLGLHRVGQKSSAISSNVDSLMEEPGLMNENDPQTAIIIAQYSQNFLSRSVSLGDKIQSEFERQGRKSFGVKQKGLEVLAGSAMPGVLVECGFINNIEEETYMNSEAGQQEIAHAIFKGIKAYKYEAER